MRQWMMRITAYADRLIDDLELLDWTDSIKAMQRNWIGRSEGARVHFDSPAGPITVFTTRPDTLFGATFMVLAPEHPLVDALTTPEHARPRSPSTRASPAAKSDVARQVEDRAKTGVFTGSYAINPVNGEPIPVWIADYVLMGYGTGAIMAVPAGDQRDFEFARQFGLAIRAIQMPPRRVVRRARHRAERSTRRRGRRRSSATRRTSTARTATLDLNGMANVAEAKRAAPTSGCEEHGRGEATINYKLRDWLFSRQRYWGEPFPIVYDEAGRAHTLPDDDAAAGAAADRQLLAAHVRPRRRDVEPGEPARPARLVGRRRARPRRRAAAPLPARHQRDAAVGRQLLVRAALPRPDEREPLRRPGGRALLDGPAARGPSRWRRPVRRRRRARRAAPAVRALLAQGAVRPRPPVLEGAVRPAVQPGLHPGRGVQGRARDLRRGASRSKSATARTSTTGARSPASGARWARA